MLGGNDLLIVSKKNGEQVPWSQERIIAAANKASRRVSDKNNRLTDTQTENLLYFIDKEVNRLPNREVISTLEIHDLVLDALQKVNLAVYMEYKAYRKYKEKYIEAFDSAKDFAEKVVYTGDKENANRDSTLNSTKQTLIAEGLMRELMLKFELEPEWARAHQEGWIHIHDLAQRYSSQTNCCLFDMGSVLSGGFELNGSRYIEPKSVQAAWAVAGDVTLSASSNQYGGFTLAEIDGILAPYAEKTYNKQIETISEQLKDFEVPHSTIEEMAYKNTMREIEQGYQGFETKLNTISNSLAQVPFVTVTFGLKTDFWAKKISETILKIRENGMGENGLTAIFPKLVFLSRKEINGAPNSPNYDLYLAAIECSRTRLYPDYLSLDAGNLGEVYDRCSKPVSPMGCRAYLSPFYKPDTGEEVYVGRNNIGAVTLNLPKMAIEANGDIKAFTDLITKYSEMVFAIHEDYYERAGKIKGSSNPLNFCEGGSWMSVGYDEPIAPILKASTASLGYVGLEEVCQSLFGESLIHQQTFALEIVTLLKKLVDDAREKTGYLFALYSSPAESLIYRFNEINREQYGLIENVTSRDYATNSFHLHVTEDVSVPEKINFEAPFHAIATGGRISYCEFAYGVDSNVLKHAIDFAMSKGMYYGVNVVSATCNECLHHGDFDEHCPKCDSEDITSVTRVCGYLSFGKVKGDSRYNLGKQAEIRDRVKHTIGYGQALAEKSKEFISNK